MPITVTSMAVSFGNAYFVHVMQLNAKPYFLGRIVPILHENFPMHCIPLLHLPTISQKHIPYVRFNTPQKIEPIVIVTFVIISKCHFQDTVLCYEVHDTQEVVYGVGWCRCR